MQVRAMLFIPPATSRPLPAAISLAVAFASDASALLLACGASASSRFIRTRFSFRRNGTREDLPHSHPIWSKRRGQKLRSWPYLPLTGCALADVLLPHPAASRAANPSGTSRPMRVPVRRDLPSILTRIDNAFGPAIRDSSSASWKPAGVAPVRSFRPRLQTGVDTPRTHGLR